jgi:hypothetical protein
MIKIQQLCPVVLGCLWLAACGSADQPRKPPPPLEETVFRDLATPIEKAKNVENVVMEQKRQTDKTVEQTESDQ